MQVFQFQLSLDVLHCTTCSADIDGRLVLKNETISCARFYERKTTTLFKTLDEFIQSSTYFRCTYIDYRQLHFAYKFRIVLSVKLALFSSIEKQYVASWN